jgi:hypothetical protein
MAGTGGPTLQELTSLDPEVPRAGRVYNVWLDRTDHFEPDREVAAEVISRRPAAPSQMHRLALAEDLYILTAP